MKPMTTQSTLAYHAPSAHNASSARAFFLGAATLSLLALFLVTMGVDPPRPQWVEGQDKLEHLIAFFAVSFLFGCGGSLLSAAAAAFGLAACAVGIEACQTLYVPGREGSVEDALAGMAGIGLGLALSLVLSFALSRTGARQRR